MKQLILIRHLKLHNANAISSPYSIGFPAMTAWLGAVHALQRRLQQQELFAGVQLIGTAVSCHSLEVQTYKGAGDYVHSIIGTANPLTKQGERSAFIEEARCHLEVSLLIEFTGVSADHLTAFTLAIEHAVQRMKFASGDVLSCRGVECLSVNEDEPSSIKKVCNKLMLGHVLIERRDLMTVRMQTGRDALDSLLDHLKITQQSSADEHGNRSWKTSRLTQGWLVPIAVGFQGISALGVAQQQRDAQTPHRFAESVVTLGEFVMPYRMDDLDKMLWHYHVDSERDLYLCRTGMRTA